MATPPERAISSSPRSPAALVAMVAIPLARLYGTKRRYQVSPVSLLQVISCFSSAEYFTTESTGREDFGPSGGDKFQVPGRWITKAGGRFKFHGRLPVIGPFTTNPEECRNRVKDPAGAARIPYIDLLIKLFCGVLRVRYHSSPVSKGDQVSPREEVSRRASVQGTGLPGLLPGMGTTSR